MLGKKKAKHRKNPLTQIYSKIHRPCVNFFCWMGF